MNRPALTIPSWCWWNVPTSVNQISQIGSCNRSNIHLIYLGGRGVRLVKSSFHKKCKTIANVSGYLITFLESNFKKNRIKQSYLVYMMTFGKYHNLVFWYITPGRWVQANVSIWWTCLNVWDLLFTTLCNRPWSLLVQVMVYCLIGARQLLELVPSKIQHIYLIFFFICYSYYHGTCINLSHEDIFLVLS